MRAAPIWTTIVIALATPWPATATATLEPGTWLDAKNAHEAEGLLPEEFLQRYRTGEWRHQVAEPKAGVNVTDPQWMGATEENRGRFTVNEDGSIRQTSDGKEPKWIWGAPFPEIDPKDPDAGIKLVWNFFYRYWGSVGNNRNSVALTWVSRDGVDREATNTVLQRFWDGQKPHRIPDENPMNLLFQQFVSTDSPADLHGINALTWRYRDTRRDSTWSYVPALRRVRQVSPSNRSDGFLGSDMSQDDGGYFDAKPEDFTWKVIGEGEQLYFFDRAAVVDGKEHLTELPDGGWRAVYPDVPRFAYERPDFDPDESVAWAPDPDRYVLIQRPVWIVEGTPKDRYYLYGKIVLRLDKEDWTGSGSYASKYDWKGNVINSYLPGGRTAFFEKKDDYRGYAEAGFTMSQNWKLDRATTSRVLPDAPSDSLIEFDDQTFHRERLSRGK